MKNTGISAIVLICLMLVARCSNNEHTSIIVPEEVQGISGVLYNDDGSALKNIVVTIRKKSSLADTSETALAKTMINSNSTITNESGKFTFKSDLDPDIYVIEAKNQYKAVLIDSLIIGDTNSTLELEPYTLKPVGAIKGAVHLSYADRGQQNIYVLAFGIDRYVKVDTDGNFMFTGLAEGMYTLRLVSGNKEYGTRDIQNVVVYTDDTTDLSTIELPYLNVPTPQNLTVTYDTLKQAATLRWNKLDSTIINGFNIYRRNVDSNTIFNKPLNINPFTGNLFIDSLGQQDMTYEYCITAINSSSRESVKSIKVQATFASYFTIDTTFNFSFGSQEGQHKSIADIAVSQNDEIFVVDDYNSRIQVYDSSLYFLRQICDGILNVNKIGITGDTVITVKEEYTEEAITFYIMSYSSKGVFFNNITTHPFLGGICANNGIIYATVKDTIFKYGTDGTLMQSFLFDSYRVCYKITATDSSIFLSTDSKIVKLNSNGTFQAEFPIPDRNVFCNDIAFDSLNQILYISCNNLPYTDIKRSKKNGVVYAFDKTLTKVAEYWLWNIYGANISLAVQRNGSLLIGLGIEQNKIIKLNPLKQ